MNPDKSYESNWLSWVSPLRLPYVFPSLSQYIPIYHGCSTKTDTWGNKWPTEPFWGLFKGTLLSPCRFHHFEIFTSHYSQTCHMIYCRLYFLFFTWIVYMYIYIYTYSRLYSRIIYYRLTIGFSIDFFQTYYHVRHFVSSFAFRGHAFEGPAWYPCRARDSRSGRLGWSVVSDHGWVHGQWLLLKLNIPNMVKCNDHVSWQNRDRFFFWVQSGFEAFCSNCTCAFLHGMF